jgi:hypothetical protein
MKDPTRNHPLKTGDYRLRFREGDGLSVIAKWDQ